METMLFDGVGVALVTLFHSDHSLDAKSTAGLAAKLVDLGARAIVVAGTTGEARSLEPDERIELLSEVRKVIPTNSGVPIIVGTGAPSAWQSARLTQRARLEGADGFLVLSPRDSCNLQGYYEEVRKAAGNLPVLAYHFPAVSSPGIPMSDLNGLPIDGCKDSSGSATRMIATLSRFHGRLYIGSAGLLALAGPAGCAGAILALANAELELCAAAFNGDIEAQVALVEAEQRAIQRFPNAIKGMTAERFGSSDVSRLC